MAQGDRAVIEMLRIIAGPTLHGTIVFIVPVQAAAPGRVLPRARPAPVLARSKRQAHEAVFNPTGTRPDRRAYFHPGPELQARRESAQAADPPVNDVQDNPRRGRLGPEA